MRPIVTRTFIFSIRGLAVPRWTRAVALGLLLTVLAQADALRGSWVYRAWQTDDGLLNNDVTCLAQAPDGAMLFATRGGLSRFDGLRFREIEINAPGWRGGGVTAVLPARDGTRWLVARSAVVRQQPGKLDLVLKLPAFAGPGSRETAFFQDAEGALWLCYQRGRFVRIQSREVKQVEVAPGLAPTFATCATADAHGQVWAAGSGVLARWRGGRFEPVADLPKEDCAMTRAARGGLWIGAGRKLLRYEEGDAAREIAGLAVLPEKARITALLEDRRGLLWIGTFDGGLWVRAGDTLQPIPLSHPDVWWLSEDHEGNVWAATGGGGACRVRPVVITKFAEPGGPRGQVPRALCRDTRGDIWVATQSSQLFARRAGQWQLLTPGSDWPGANAFRVNAGAQGRVWIADLVGNLTRWDGERFETIALPGKPGEALISLMETGDGSVWIGRGSQVWRRRDAQWENVPVPAGSGAAQVLAEDSAHRVWAGTVGGFLLREEHGRLTREAATELGPACNGVRALLFAPDGALLVGTQGAGIARLKDGACHLITREHGLPHNVISQLALDAQGRLWAGSDAGIFAVSLNELTAVAEDRARTLRSTVFGRSEGVSGVQAQAGSPGVLTDGDGRLWFATRNGIVVADPAAVGTNTAPPPVSIEQLRVGDQPVPLRSPVAIGPGAADVRFDLAAMSFTAPEHVRLEHRLDGIDRGWITTPADRSVTYAQLPPGSYKLRARAANNDGVWSAQDATLAFVVRPFFWQTMWFQMSVSVAAIGAALAGMHFATGRRLRRQAEQHRRETELERERTRIARDMHDQVGASLTQISLLAEFARADGDAGEDLSRLAKTARDAVVALDEIVWAVNPRHDNLPSLLEYLGQQVRDLLNAAGIRCRLDFPDEVPPRPLSAEFRHHLFLLAREAVNNAVKNAAPREVRISVELTPNELRATIADDGRGFSADTVASTSEGLRNMRARAADLGGECVIQSQPGGGTTVCFRLPWPNAPAASAP